jgi:hypothetical protein
VRRLASFADIRRDCRIRVSDEINAVGRFSDTSLEDLLNLHTLFSPIFRGRNAKVTRVALPVTAPRSFHPLERFSGKAEPDRFTRG